MRNIEELDVFIRDNFGKVQERVAEAQRQSAEQLYRDAKSRIVIPGEATRNPQQFQDYLESLKLSQTEQVGDKVSTKVYSDLVVDDGSKWDGVPIGAFLEYGTGPLGEDSNKYPHGYQYTTDKPWDSWTWLQSGAYYDKQKKTWVYPNKWGIVARPHLIPALMSIRATYIDKIRKAIKQ